MTEQQTEDDFTVVDTGMPNRFFRDYQAGHGRSGTNTKQRNLRHLPAGPTARCTRGSSA
jgi:hypothetical protein